MPQYSFDAQTWYGCPPLEGFDETVAENWCSAAVNYTDFITADVDASAALGSCNSVTSFPVTGADDVNLPCTLCQDMTFGLCDNPVLNGGAFYDAGFSDELADDAVLAERTSSQMVAMGTRIERLRVYGSGRRPHGPCAVFYHHHLYPCTLGCCGPDFAGTDVPHQCGSKYGHGSHEYSCGFGGKLQPSSRPAVGALPPFLQHLWGRHLVSVADSPVGTSACSPQAGCSRRVVRIFDDDHLDRAQAPRGLDCPREQRKICRFSLHRHVSLISTCNEHDCPSYSRSIPSARQHLIMCTNCFHKLPPQGVSCSTTAKRQYHSCGHVSSSSGKGGGSTQSRSASWTCLDVDGTLLFG
eukprot:scaffold177_cov334-Pavlova_lutheri.AAC.109